MFTKQELLQLYTDQDLSSGQISEIKGCCRATVLTYLKKFEIPRRSPGHKPGERSANWRGGRRKHNGYVYIWMPQHPRNKGNYIAEHIVVMEQHVGRRLKSTEVVHHRNRKRDDNRIENLKLFSDHAEHLRAHWKLREEPSTELGKMLRDLYELGETWDIIAAQIGNL